jgi:hypothetical protein
MLRVYDGDDKREERAAHHETPDLSSLFTWEGDLPRPHWDLVSGWIRSRTNDGFSWAEACRAWLTALAEALGDSYDYGESKHFQAVSPVGAMKNGALLGFLERCRSELESGLGNVARFQAPGKEVVVALDTIEEFWRYVKVFYPSDDHRVSGGLHIRELYPHVVVTGQEHGGLEDTLAHELTHAALQHLTMPQWLEEGLAQVFACAVTNRRPIQLDREMAEEHCRHWNERGLHEFWRGDGFHSTGEECRLNYQLAEILVRLLIEDGRPRWFGLVQEPHRRFLDFLRNASAADCGATSCRKHLGYDLADLAGRFLGPGDWSPSRPWRPVRDSRRLP